MPIANRLLDAKPSGVEFSLITYDLGGITYYSRVDVFPAMPPVADPRDINTGCYNKVSWDRYAWWGEAPCAIGFDTVRAAFVANRQSPTRWWLMSIVHHPMAYAEHRFSHFSRNIRLSTNGPKLPSLSPKSDPNEWNIITRTNPLSDAIDRLAVDSERTPLGWPFCWMLLGSAALLALPQARQRGCSEALLWSGLLYGLSDLPLSVASEVRNHLWTMLALGIGSLQAFDARWGLHT